MKRTIKLIGALVIASVLMAGGVMLVQENVHKETNVPKTLAGKITENIIQHPNDWTVLSEPHISDGDCESKTIENKKCNIRLEIIYTQLNTFITVIGQDTVFLGEDGRDNLIDAYNKYIVYPREAERSHALAKLAAKNDSLIKIKEDRILNNLCKD